MDKNINISDFDTRVYDNVMTRIGLLNISEGIKEDFEDELENLKKLKLGEYDETKYRYYLVNLCLYTSKIDEIPDELGKKIEGEGHKGGLVKLLNKLLVKCDEYSYIDKSIMDYSKSLKRALPKNINDITTEIKKLEKASNVYDYNSVFNALEKTKTIINRFAEHGVLSRVEATAKGMDKDDISKIGNLNFYIQDIIIPLVVRCFNVAYWLNKGGYGELGLQWQHASDENISAALDTCLKDVPIKEMGKLLYFSEGNEKLDKNIYIFSLPAGKSCPGATNCKTTVEIDNVFRKSSLKKLAGNKFTCYAASGQSIYPSKYYKAMVNFKILKEYCKSVDDVTTVLNTMVGGFSDYSIVRIHDAGDFFSTNYLQGWLNVAELHPKILFYAYTTSIMMLKNIADKRGHLPANFVFNESEENMTRLFNDKADEIVKSIKERGILKTRVMYNTFKEAEQQNMKIDVNDTLAMRGDISEFGLLIHGKGQTGNQRIYADKFSILNSFPNDSQTLIKLYYKLPKKYRDRIDVFYDDKNVDSIPKMKDYVNSKFSDIKTYILENNIKPDATNVMDIINTVLDNTKPIKINPDKQELLLAYAKKEIDYILSLDKNLSKQEAKELVKVKLNDIMDLL